MTISHYRDRVESVEPALDDLAKKQDQLFGDLADGFGSRREVLLWCHDASLRTLGQLPDEWAAELFSNRYQLTAMLEDQDQRGEVSAAVEDPERAQVERSVLADDSLVAACRRGMTVLSDQSVEYTDLDTPIDAGNQSYLAMRPALDDLAERQRQVLRRALGLTSDPIDSRADVRDWVRSAIRACKGRDQGLSEKVLWTPHRLASLRGSPHSATLHLTLADDLLGPFNSALRQTATAATEQASEDRSAKGSFET